MSTNVLPSSITLTVLNPEKLLQGSEPRHRFDRAGGSIGSQGAWRLHDRGVRILPVHCEIGWHEGHFCIIDHSGKSFMNGSDSQLLSGTPIRLRHNDRLQMGDYQIAIHLGEDEVEPEPHTGRDPLCELGVMTSTRIRCGCISRCRKRLMRWLGTSAISWGHRWS
ncbi:FHA domain-containing protein [Pseudomonas asiatica]|uniref:FHA domain-containing protein n=1 Tax=Pseudomonas asiatica TaxID=2219225 RepID=UPI001AB00335|nr:FHA domain-containing protein [Pseudomonas asiatica]